MKYLKIRNWEKWQSYRSDRGQPPWIKIHRCVMRNLEWISLTDAERGQLVAIWLLAADHNGVIPASPEMIQKVCYLENPPNLNKFIELKFICHNDAKLTSQGRQNDSPDKNRIEKNREDKSKAFSLPSKEEINESSKPKLKSDIDQITEKLYNEKIFPKVHAFKNKMLKDGKNERTILHVLTRCYLKRTFDEGAWAYCMKIIQIEDGNYNERDYLKTIS